MFKRKSNPISPYGSLELLDIEKDGHWYKDDKGTIFPSITTVKKITGDDSWYGFWIKSLMYKHGVDEEEAIKLAKIIQKESLLVGNTIHEMLEDYTNNKKIKKYNEEFAVEPEKLFESVKVVLDENVDEVFATEFKMHSKNLGIAGTSDLVCMFDGVKSIVDYKNSRRYISFGEVKKKGYCEQLCAYAEMWNELFDDDIKQGISIIASWDGRCRIFKINIDEYKQSLMEMLNKYHEITYNKT